MTFGAGKMIFACFLSVLILSTDYEQGLLVTISFLKFLSIPLVYRWSSFVSCFLKIIR